MIIGVPQEIKNNENRVAVTAAGVKAFTSAGHQVLIESGAGLGSGIKDKAYQEAGAKIIATATEVYQQAEMIIKVKEPLASECKHLSSGQILFTYLHLAADEKLTKLLKEKEVVAIAYETVEKEDGSLPLLTPMSEVAGRLAILAGTHCLQKDQGGNGVLVGGVPGVKPGKVVIIGGGTVGINSAKMALGLGADVTILDVEAEKMRYLDDIFQGRAKTLMSNEYNIAEEVKTADLVIGAVLIPGGKAPYLVSEKMVKQMKEGSVIVDVAIDQGGCIQTSQPTTYAEPSYKKHGVIHYGVSNMPGTVPLTSTYALTNVTLPYALEIANKGYKQSIKDNQEIARGVNVYQGNITHKKVAEAFNYQANNISKLL